MKLGPEDRIHIAILDYLEVVLPRGLVWHTPNQGKRSFTTAGKLKLLGMRAGVPDITIVYEGRIYFLEVKAPKGRLSPEQGRFGVDAIAAGAGWAVVRSIDDVRQHLQTWKIQTLEAA